MKKIDKYLENLTEKELAKLLIAGNQLATDLKKDLKKLTKDQLVELIGDFIGDLGLSDQLRDSVFLENPTEKELKDNFIEGKTLLKVYHNFKEKLKKHEDFK